MRILPLKPLPALATAAACAFLAAPSLASATPFLSPFTTLSTLSSAVPTSGPAAGDVNPYGVAVVPTTTGELVAGDVLVSNFNNRFNQQGTGSSIVEISPAGQMRVFAVVPPPTDTGAVGLTTALVALPEGFVVVGNLPARDGNSANAKAGGLTVLNARGQRVATITGHDINGPWDMTAVQEGNQEVLFVTNVLNGTVAAGGATVNRGTVVRITLSFPSGGGAPVVTSSRVIGDGFAEHTDPNALVVGPTGVGLGDSGTLYVADSANNRIAAIPNALTRTTPLGGGGMTVSTAGALNDPLGLAIAPGGHIITANGADGRLVETTPSGQQVAAPTLLDPGAGDLFGLAIAPGGTGVYLVNDSGSGLAANSLDLLH